MLRCKYCESEATLCFFTKNGKLVALCCDEHDIRPGEENSDTYCALRVAELPNIDKFISGGYMAMTTEELDDFKYDLILGLDADGVSPHYLDRLTDLILESNPTGA
jgi:hypothetical protein